MAAVNGCFRPHFPAAPELTVEGFREEMRRLDVWPSNSLVAVEGDRPIAVLIGTKRPREVLVQRLGVASSHQRRGHGSHLLTSLSQKLAVLGPERLIAEVPEGMPGVAPFLAAVGYRLEAEYTDFLGPEPEAAGAVESPAVSLAELEASEALPETPGTPWERQLPTLRQSRGLAGLALPGEAGARAWALYTRTADAVEVWASGGPPGRPPNAWLPALLAALGRHQRRVRLARLLADEYPGDLLRQLGLRAETRYHRWAAHATPL
ncbi:MAG TPA: GNAT family N-acetyltransferase [Thermoanaerobaculia bacterium]|nr:GNAT family N-acetyltransferase [Thermoanaerobaculia bacterium]